MKDNNLKKRLYYAFRISPWAWISLALILVVVISLNLPSAIQNAPAGVLQERSKLPEMAKVDPNVPLREQTRIYELAGRRFEIPIMYIDGSPNPGEKQESLLLEVIWPEMRSIWELHDRAEYDRIRRDEHRLGWMLLEEASLRPSLDSQNSEGEKGLTRFEHAGVWDGLERGLWYRGLKDQPELWAEVFLEKNSAGEVISFIRCRRGPNSRFPTCKHKFTEGGLIFQITYNEQTFLPQWKEQRIRAINFLKTFEIKH